MEQGVFARAETVRLVSCHARGRDLIDAVLWLFGFAAQTSSSGGVSCVRSQEALLLLLGARRREHIISRSRVYMTTTIEVDLPTLKLTR